MFRKKSLQIIAVLFTVVAMVAAAFSARAEDVPQVVLDSRNGVVRVVIFTPDGMAMSMGTGFCIGSTDEVYVVTNAHVVDPSDDSIQPEIRVYYETGRYVKAVVYDQSFKQDLAVLQLEEEIPGAQILPLQTERIYVGTAAYALGFPGSVDEASGDFENYIQGSSVFVADKDALSLTGGSIASIRNSTTVGNASSIVKTLQTTTAISGGNSGGPLLDKNGCVVGINTFVGLDENGSISPGVGFAVHVEELMMFLDSNGIYYTVAMQNNIETEPQPEMQPETEQFSTTAILLIAFFGVALMEGIIIIVLMVHNQKNTANNVKFLSIRENE